MKKAVYVSLFSAFICVGAFIQIPLPLGVPVVIQDMMAILAGFLLGPIYGSLSVLVFLILGSIGLPVFTGKAGIQVIFQGLTGGFLVGYLVAAIIAGLFALIYEKTQKSQKQKEALLWIFYSLGAIFAFTAIFLLGLFQFSKVGNLPLGKAFVASVLPYLPATVLKILVLVPLAKRFCPIMKNYLY